MAKADSPEPIPATRISIYELTENTCRWPIGEPKSPDFCYCGGRAVEGLPYCGHHCRMAYPPPALFSVGKITHRKNMRHVPDR